MNVSLADREELDYIYRYISMLFVSRWGSSNL